MKITICNFWGKNEREELFQCGDFLELEWNQLLLAKKNPRGANNSAHLCLLLINQFFSQINTAKGVLSNDEF